MGHVQELSYAQTVLTGPSFSKGHKILSHILPISLRCDDCRSALHFKAIYTPPAVGARKESE